MHCTFRCNGCFSRGSGRYCERGPIVLPITVVYYVIDVMVRFYVKQAQLVQVILYAHRDSDISTSTGGKLGAPYLLW